MLQRHLHCQLHCIYNENQSGVCISFTPMQLESPMHAVPAALQPCAPNFCSNSRSPQNGASMPEQSLPYDSGRPWATKFAASCLPNFVHTASTHWRPSRPAMSGSKLNSGVASTTSSKEVFLLKRRHGVMVGTFFSGLIWQLNT